MNTAEIECLTHEDIRHRIESAGLLTCSRSEAFPILAEDQWPRLRNVFIKPRAIEHARIAEAGKCQRKADVAELHSSGTVRDSHPVPFSLRPSSSGRRTESAGKDNGKSGKTTEACRFFCLGAAVCAPGDGGGGFVCEDIMCCLWVRFHCGIFHPENDPAAHPSVHRSVGPKAASHSAGCLPTA